MSRRGALAIVTVVAVAAAALGWVAGRQIKSPAEIAADTAPPPASNVTVPIETLSLSSSVITRGDVVFADSLNLRVSASIDGSTIVTRMPWQVGDELTEGDVIVEIGGRPVFALQGELPVFRSFGPSVNGPDVEQLEIALDRLGLAPGTIDGVYDADTQDAVEQLYRNAGYTPNLPSVDDLARLDGDEDAVTAAERRVRDLSQQGTGLPESQRLQLQGEIDRSQRALDDATRQRDDAIAPFWEALDAAQTDLDAAQADLEEAAARRVQGQQGTDPDTGAAITPAKLDELIAAEVALTATRDGFLAVRDDAAAAEADVKREQDGFVADAANQLAIAQASLNEARSGDGGISAEDVSDAREDLADARERLDQTRAQIGTTFPAAELLFLPFLPREVQQINVEVGDFANEAVMTVTGSGARVDGSVSAADRSLVSVGQRAVLDNASLDLEFEAQITEVADEPSGGAGRYRVRFEPTEQVPVDAYFQNFRVTIPIDTTGGDVLAVPLAALSANADGSARVEVEDADGTVRRVEVIPGLRAQGFVQITPVDDELAEGDRVVVGLATGGSTDTGDDADGDDGEDGSDTDESSDDPDDS